MQYRFYCTIIFIFSCLSDYAQQNRITGKFVNASIDAVIRQVESMTTYHFYYDSTDLNGIGVNIEADKLTLSGFLDKAFRNTDLHYALDSTTGNVFITKGTVIHTALPAIVFNAGSQISNKEILPAIMPKQGPMPKNILKVSAENKLFEVGEKTAGNMTGKSTIAGYVRDNRSGEPISGATIFIDSSTLTLTTDQFGYFSLTLSKGRHALKISGFGMKDARRQIMVYSDGKFDIDLYESVESLKTVIVSAQKGSNTGNVQMGVNRLNIQTIKLVPVVFGENDILKVVLTLPGVTSVGEASNGFNVRGGAVDQNLILFNDATIYNPSHLFGFFSAFDPDIVKGIELYKSAITEKYGGRLSSVLDVTIKDGNNKKWTGTAGIGPLTSKFTIEGPVDKKTSVIAGARTTYSNWLLGLIQNSAYTNSRANFYDANIHITHTYNAKNSLYVMGYISRDHFRMDNDSNYKYSNKNVNVKWKHIFNNKSYAVVTAGIDNYRYSVSSEQVPVNGFKLGFMIDQTYLRSDFSYSPNNKHVISYGLNSIYYKLHPGSYDPSGSASLVVPNHVQPEQALESALYLGDQYSINSNLTVSAGVRYSIYNYLGPHEQFNYVPGLPREVITIKDTTFYSKGKVIKTYMAPEIRLSIRYALSASASVKASFNTTQQYIHMLSNTTNISPTDIWKLSDPYIKPQQGQQISLGIYKNFRANTIETSLEVYYKKMYDVLDYKSGATLLLNPHIETDVISARGKAYGIEFLFKKTAGKINGWLSYTYSRTLLKGDDPLAGEQINGGKYYPASFDKPHNVNFISNYRFSHRYSASLNIVYSTGRPITLPIAAFDVGGSPSLYYSNRNQYRIPDYFRSDISVNLDGNHKVNQRFHNSWSVGIYNLTGRQNAYSVYFIQENGKVKGYQLSIFGTLIPFVTYNIKF